MMYRLFGGLFLILSTYPVVCLFHVPSRLVCLDYTVLGLFEFGTSPVLSGPWESDCTPFAHARDAQLQCRNARRGYSGLL